MTTVEFSDETLGLDFSGLEKKHAVILNENYSNIVVIDHLPVIDQSKEEKLLAVLRKNVFAPAKAKIVESWMPKGQDGMSKGYLFVELETPEQAESAYHAIHGYKLDKSHVLFAIRFSDFERLEQMDETAQFKEPQLEPFQEKEFLKEWLLDPMARDQFVCQAGTSVSVQWNGKIGSGIPEVAHSRPNWTDSFVQWSPRGSYLATVHGPGVMLWGGASWNRLGKFPHAGVKLISFSPAETFLVTWSPFERQSECNLLVWDISAAKLVRGFVVEGNPKKTMSTNENASLEGEEGDWIWPLLRFSHNDIYCSRIHDDNFSIYETTAGFSLLDKQSLNIGGIREVFWSPTESRLVYWTAGTDDSPARVALMQIPSKLILRTKNLFNVIRCKVSWQTEGEYFCVQVDRHGKTRKPAGTHLEIFRLKEKDVPVEVVELKEHPLVPVTAVAWEPRGERLLIAQNLEFKSIVSLYTMTAIERGSHQVRLIRAPIEVKQMGRFLWSPRGDYLIMASLDSTAAVFEFWNMTEGVKIATKEHFLATDIQWDPSGRYAASWVSYWRHQMDNGYVIWDFKGEQRHKQNQSKFCYFSWRPRPPTHLSKEEEKKVRKNLKTYSIQFDELDQQNAYKESSNISETRNRQMKTWNNFRIRAKLEWEEKRSKREAITGRSEFGLEGINAAMLGGGLVKAEEWIEEVVEETEEIVEEAEESVVQD